MKRCSTVFGFAALIALPILTQAEVAPNCGIPASTVAALQLVGDCRSPRHAVLGDQ